MSVLFDFSHPVTWLAWVIAACLVLYTYSHAYRLKRAREDAEFTRAKRDIIHAGSDTTLLDQQELNKHKGLTWVNVNAEKELKRLDAELSILISTNATDQDIKKMEKQVELVLKEDIGRALNGAEAEQLGAIQDHVIRARFRTRLFELYDQLHGLTISNDPYKNEKLRILRREVAALRRDIDGGLGQASLPKPNGKKPRRPEADEAGSGELQESGREEAE
jgi:hypothetical protein